MDRPRRLGVIASGAVLSLVLGAAARADDVPPKFEGGVDVVAVDANVVDGKGQPVRDLAPEEFVVKVDGRTRRVLSADFVDLTGPRQSSSPGEGPSSATAPLPGSPRSTRRLVVLVADRGELSAGGARKATQAAARLLDQLGADDRVAVFSLPSGPRLDFTSDRAAIGAALGRIGPARDIVEGEAMSLRQRLDAHVRSATDRLNALEALLRALAVIPGPKVIVLITGGLTALEAPMERQSGEPLAPPVGVSGQVAVSVVQHLRRIATAAAAARASVYSVYVSERDAANEASKSLYGVSNVSGAVNADPQHRVAALEMLTTMSGGTMFEIVAGGNHAFERVASEISGHYLLGLEPAEGDRDGKPHTIEVKVRRKKLEVRARRQFVVPAARPPAGPESAS